MRRIRCGMMTRLILGLIGLFVLPCTLPAQVSLMPFPSQQFMDENGLPCGGCLVYTYASGTSTPQATYTDYTGATQNTNPVVLNSAGYPESGSNLVGIWLSPGVAYRITLTLANGSQVYQIDGVYGGAQSTAANAGNQAVTTVTYSSTPTFTAVGQNQLFKMTLTGNVTSSSLVMSAITPPGIVSFEITQDAVGGRTFTWPVNVIGAGVVDPVLNSTTFQQFIWDGANAYAASPALYAPGPYFEGSFFGTFTTSSSLPATAGVVQLASGDAACWRNVGNNGNVCIRENGIGQLYSPVYLSNAGTTGTTTYALTKLDASGFAVSTSAGDVSGVVGITQLGAGTSGTAILQSVGITNCIFDAATTAQDYVQISSSAPGNCHDTGSSTFPIGGGQVIGRVLTTNGSAGTYAIVLFGGEIQPISATQKIIYSSGVAVNVSALVTTIQYMQIATPIPAGALNVLGKTLRITTVESTGTGLNATNVTTSLGFGPTSSLGTYETLVQVSGTPTGPVTNVNVTMYCVVGTTGSSGQLVCNMQGTTNNNGTIGPPSQTAFGISVNLTSALYIGQTCQYSAAFASNTCTGQTLIVEQLN